ncbi:hypothetical protein [uncultured Methanobrevibacter sp.]|uniref:hypothetical protein n=1 Tax=uncultured Methanobrevibacter sp. TaxID=253161 RepID=UPI0025D49509|nr:hypothetical protein [uncultured Methanobrevibacter sp.]
MIVYICKLAKFNKKEFLSNLPNNVSIVNNESTKIECTISVSNINKKFVIYSNSNFLFIFTNKKSEKRKIFKELYSIFQEDISYFNPNYEDEYNFLQSFEENVSLKFIHKNKIVYSNKLTNMYFNKILDDNYYLFEAKIELNPETHCFFLYYVDAIKIKDKFKDNINHILSLFEKGWAVA